MNPNVETAPTPSPPPVRKISPSESAKRMAKEDWITRYVAEWSLLANGRVDMEYATVDGSTLQHVVGHRPPEEVARQHFNSSTGADSTVERAEEKYQALAAEVGLLPAGSPLSKEQLDFAYGVAVLCASVGDRFRDPREGSAGDQIRASYGPVPF